MSRSRPTADPDLLIRLRQGDESAFVELLDRHQAALRRLAIASVGSAAIADEIVQETWAAVIEGLESFEGRSTLKTWIFRILLNRANTRRVREARSVPLSAFEDGEDAPAVDPTRFRPDGHWSQPPRRWDEETPERLLLRAEARSELTRALAQLPPKQRMVVTLRDIEGLSSEEVCNLLELTETNQRVLLHRGRSRLRAELERILEKKG